MKAFKLIPGLIITLTLFAACKKESEKAIDCFGESLKVSVHINVSSTNAKHIDTEVKYWGSKKISGVRWEYGDGSTESTTALVGSHIYNSSGTFTVKARVTFTEGKSSCEVDPTKSVDIN